MKKFNDIEEINLKSASEMFDVISNKLINRNDSDNLRYIYTGFQIMSPDVFDHVSLKVFSINKIWDKLIRNKVLLGKESSVDFLHVSNLTIYKSLLKKYFRH